MSDSALLVSCLFLASVTSVLHADTKPALFHAGAASVDISPRKLPAIIAGGFLEKQAAQINDRLRARCIVLDDGKTRIAFAIVDTCMMTQSLIDEAKQLASRQCGIPVDHMMVSATHTHSAPAAMACLGTRLDTDYAAFLPGKIAEGIAAAAKNLRPARIGWASIDDWEHTHNRRWIRRPETAVVDPFGDKTGLANMHPGYLSPDIIGPSGPVDPGLAVLSIQSPEGRPVAVLANYSQHYFGSPAVSADYYGLFCKHLARLLGEPGDGNGPFVCAMSQGTSGDLMWMDYGSPKKDFAVDGYAEAVAKYAVRALKGIEYHDAAPLAIMEKTLELKYRVPDAKRLEWARPIAARIKDDLAKDKQEVYAKEAIILHERQRTELKLQAIRIGGLSISTLPNEVYALTGLKLKAQSPFSAHFNIELANGAEGYIPTPEQHELGGYTTWPARTAGLEVQAEPRIVETLLGALEEVTGGKRRPMVDDHGPYARAVMKAGPVSYWRLNDAEGRIARNAVADAPDARITGGVAWYLPGAGSGTGTGAGEKLMPSAFSGPKQINRAAHFAAGDMTADLGTPGAESSVALWFWLGEASGASERSGELAAWSGKEKIIARQSADHHVRLTSSNDGTAGSSRDLRADQWHFAVINHSRGRVAVHVDGAAKPDLEFASGSAGLNGTLRFGKGLQGKLDEVAVFSRPLDPSEIAALWKTSGIGEARTSAADIPLPKPKMESLPLPPEESLKKIHVPEGYEVELVAAEPLVLDPVAFDWDERGRLWVVEMADYPLGMDGIGKPGGRVVVLEDTNSDGRYDQRTEIAAGLNFPTGILCWRGGCLVSAAPEVLFLKDSNGSGKADVRQKLLTGFLEGNQQLRVNGLRWGLDGWVYCANGGHHVNYGKDIAITSTLTGEKIALGSRDFRFKPDTGEFDPLSGPSQFGRNRDAWGHWFGVQNSYPIWHFVLEDRYLRRNPHVPSPGPKHVMTGSNPPVYPLSGGQKRYHSFNQAGRFTSACAAAPYLDTLLFGDGQEIHSFTSEPVHNVIQHMIVEDDGASFKARRAESGSQPDFFASEDRWCRPVMTRTGPDGALWIADMYRYMIEHPAWLPQGGKDDFLPFYREGEDKGRIYRIYPKGRRPGPVKSLESMSAPGLVALLESSNGWLRDRAQMLLQTRADPAVVPALEKLAAGSTQPLARAHALSVLEALNALSNETLIAALRDDTVGVREHALRLAEKHADGPVVSAAAKLADDAHAKVRLQLALSLGEWKQPVAGEALVKLFAWDRNDPFVRGALVSSLLPHLTVAARELGNAPDLMMEPLARTALAEKRDDIILAVSRSTIEMASSMGTQAIEAYRTLLLLLRDAGVTVESLAARHSEPEWGELVARKSRLMEELQRSDWSRKSGDIQAIVATTLLLDSKTEASGIARLSSIIGSNLEQDMVSFADHVSFLARSKNSHVPEILFQGWEARTPERREHILDAMMSREAWTALLLGKVKEGKLSASAFDAQRQARLLKHPSAKVRKLAEQVFAGAVTAARATILEAFRPALSLTGDSAKGRAVFAQACIACHQVDGAGRALGPDLRSVVGHDAEKLLNSILDPSANIEPGFTAYFCELKNGEQLYGIVSGESGGGIALKLADGSMRDLRRSEIVKLQSSKASFMPDGLEAVLTPQSLADLIAYLKLPK